MTVNSLEHPRAVGATALLALLWRLYVRYGRASRGIARESVASIRQPSAFDERFPTMYKGAIPEDARMLPALFLFAASLGPWVEALGSWCEDLDVPADTTLAVHGDPPSSPGLQLRLYLSESGMRLGPQRTDADRLPALLQQKHEASRPMGDTSEVSEHAILLVVDEDVPALRVHTAITQLRSSPFQEVRALVGAEWTPPAAPDPTYAAELQAEVERQGSERGAAVLYEASQSEPGCAPVAEAMKAVARATPSNRCVMLTQNLERIASSCTEAEVQRTLTPLFMDLTPRHRLSWFQVPPGPLPAPEGTWKTWSRSLRGDAPTGPNESEPNDQTLGAPNGILGALSDARTTDGAGLGGLIGAKGVQVGSGGLGARGSGLGGGGSAAGLGGLGTASTYGAEPKANARVKGRPELVMYDPIIMGALDRTLMDEVIEPLMTDMARCAPKRSEVEGKVVLKFTVAGNGTVSRASVKSTSLEGSEIPNCMVSVLQKAVFPAPRGGGIVIASYPFRFLGSE